MRKRRKRERKGREGGHPKDEEAEAKSEETTSILEWSNEKTNNNDDDKSKAKSTAAAANNNNSCDGCEKSSSSSLDVTLNIPRWKPETSSGPDAQRAQSGRGSRERGRAASLGGTTPSQRRKSLTRRSFLTRRGRKVLPSVCHLQRPASCRQSSNAIQKTPQNESEFCFRFNGSRSSSFADAWKEAIKRWGQYIIASTRNGGRKEGDSRFKGGQERWSFYWDDPSHSPIITRIFL